MEYKQFIKISILGFIIGIITILPLCLISGEMFVRQVIIPLDGTNAWRNNLEDRLKNPQSVKAILLGDSHTAWGIEKNVQSILNIAMPGDNYILAYYKLKHCINKGLTPKVVLLQFDIHQISAFKDNHSRYIEAFDIIDKDIIEKTDFELNITDYLYINGLKQFKRSISSKILRLMYKYIDGTLENKLTKKLPTWDKISKKRKENILNTRLIKFYGDNSISSDNINFIPQIIQLCRDNNIEPILISYPVLREISEKTPSKFSEKYNSLKSKYTKNTLFWDYSSLYDGKHEKFRDWDHLHDDTGTKEFTLELKNRINNYLSKNEFHIDK